ncbi:MAG: intradiol ring-cleavage dioxygenase [Steroidobacteraceae bacterium]
MLTRREAVRLLGAACIVRPAQTEGPFFVEPALERSDLRIDPSDGSVTPGLPLALTMAVSQKAGKDCLPLSGARVDVWHCDHRGAYSGVRDPRFDTSESRFLRGYQVTDAAGEARFMTIYPGWYSGRAVHIHFKVRNANSADNAGEFISQLYFDDALNERVHSSGVYAARGPARVKNADDRIFRSGGDQLLLRLLPQREGYAGRFDLMLEGN